MSNEFNEPFFIPPPPGSQVRNYVKPLDEIVNAKATVEAEISARAYQPVEGVRVYRCECQRCPTVWHTLQQSKPKTCPGCRSAWWDRPRTPRQKNPSSATPKEKKKSVKGGKRGRPRKYALPEVQENRQPQLRTLPDEKIPDIPLELLETAGGFIPPQRRNAFVAPSGTADPFPVPTPFSDPIPVPASNQYHGDPPMESGQPADDGGGSGYTDEVLPPLPPEDDDEYWYR